MPEQLKKILSVTYHEKYSKTFLFRPLEIEEKWSEKEGWCLVRGLVTWKCEENGFWKICLKRGIVFGQRFSNMKCEGKGFRKIGHKRGIVFGQRFSYMERWRERFQKKWSLKRDGVFVRGSVTWKCEGRGFRKLVLTEGWSVVRGFSYMEMWRERFQKNWS